MSLISNSNIAEAQLARLPELAGSLFVGPDVRAFLQGYLTCDTEQLQPSGPAMPMALCNLKGRVVANGWAAALADEAGVLTITHTSVAATLRAFLAKYMVFSKTEASAFESPNGLWIGLAGARRSDHNCIALDERRRLYLDVPAELTSVPSVADAFWQSMIEDARVLIQSATSEQFLPQMLGLEQWGAVDFTKGCYLGQEVVARAQHRGKVKRRLVKLRALTATAVEPGAELLDAQERPVGTVVQIAQSSESAAAESQAGNSSLHADSDGPPNMLAIVGRNTAEERKPLRVAGVKTLTVRWPA